MLRMEYRLWPQWLDCSGNQPVLHECEALLRSGKVAGRGQARLIFVMGAPRAGASALANRLQQYAKRQGINFLALPGAPWAGNVNLRNHFLQTLEVPLVTDEFWSNELVSRPYDAVVALRAYQAIFIDDGSDYFTCGKSVKRRNFERLFQLTEFPVKCQVFVFGASSVLEPIAFLAERAGLDVLRHYLLSMPNDDIYREFIERLIARHRQYRRVLDISVEIEAVHRFSKGSVGVSADVVRDLCCGMQII